ncbi:MAG: VOC family protein [Chloroflexi bacterium]|nr:VOC family protein [Chloroflexota bacterium]
MIAEHRPGSVVWIDHFVVPSNDLPKQGKFMEDVLGGYVRFNLPLTTQARMRGTPIGSFYQVGRYHDIGVFLQDKMLPASKPLGQGCPRFGFYIRESDIDFHLKRLDEAGVEHSEPVHTAAEGEEGTAIFLLDPCGNQYEFWAPRELPAGAMESDNPTRVGRISHIVAESTNLNRTAAFYQELCGLDAIENGDIAGDTLALRLLGGGRIIYKQVQELDERTLGHNIWAGAHMALVVPDEEFVAAYQRFWDQLPESEVAFGKLSSVKEAEIKPRTELHGFIANYGKPDETKRGTYVYDPDTTGFHLMGGIPLDREFGHYTYGWDDVKLLQVEVNRPIVHE